MKKKRIIYAVVYSLYATIVLALVGCNNTTVCPSYPKTTIKVLEPLKSLENNDVDNWMIEQLKLKRKLEKCNNG